MAKYKKRADGRYARQVTVGIKEGKPIKKTVYGKTIAELEKNYRDFMLLVDRNIVLDTQGMTFKQLREEWYRIKKKGKIKTNTELAYKVRMKYVKVIDDIKVKDIKRYHIESLLADIQQKGHTNTCKTILKMLESIFNYAISNDIIYKNQCAELSVIHKPKAKRVLTDKEKDLIDTADLDAREKAFIMLLRYTGIRRGELFALRKSDIDKDNMLIHINKTLIENNGSPFIQDSPKTDAGIRDIPIFLKLAKPLFDYIDTIEDYLFVAKSGKFMSSKSITIMHEKIRKKIGLGEDLTMHCFRHNFVTECYYAGVDVLRTQAWAGHSSISTTLSIYTHLEKSKTHDGEIMNEYYSSQKEVKTQSDNFKGSIVLVK